MAIIKKKDTIEPKVFRELEVSVELSSGVSAVYFENSLKVTGPKGEISKQLKYPQVYIKVDGNKVLIGTKRFTQRQKKIMHTYRAHVTNMNKGVTEGFEYKLAVVYAKFPITTELSGKKLTVKNLLGEKVPKVLTIYDDVDVKVNGKDITVTGIDKERVGQIAASIEQLTRISHFDRRVIQDGIYITQKPHKRYS